MTAEAKQVWHGTKLDDETVGNLEFIRRRLGYRSRAETVKELAKEKATELTGKASSKKKLEMPA